MRELATPGALQQWNVRESYASIAKRVGVDAETVRRRIKRSERAGVIQGWRLVVHPSLFGCVDVFVDLEVAGSRRRGEIISQLMLLDGVKVITDFEGSGLFVIFYAEPGEAMSRKVRLISTTCGGKEVAVWSRLFPPCHLKPSTTDWKIIWAMRDDPRKSISQIAEEVKATTRTVSRRLTLLTEHRALFLMGLPNFRRSAGVTGNFLILCSDGERSSVSGKIASRFDNIAFQTVFGSGMMYNIFFHNLFEAQEAHEWIKEIQGVTNVRMRITKEVILVRDWLYGEIAKRLPSQKPAPQSRVGSLA